MSWRYRRCQSVIDIFAFEISEVILIFAKTKFKWDLESELLRLSEKGNDYGCGLCIFVQFRWNF